MKIGIPTREQIKYVPSVLETMKYAWIQYLALFIPIFIVLYYGLLGFTLRAQIFETTVIDDLPKDKKKNYLF